MGPRLWNPLVLLCSLSLWNNWLDRTVEWPLEDWIIAQAFGNTSCCWSNAFQDVVCALSLHAVYGAASPIAEVHKTRYQEVEMGQSPLTVTSIMWPTSKMFVACPCTFSLCWFRRLSSKGGILPTGDTIMVLLTESWNYHPATRHTPYNWINNQKGYYTGWCDWSWPAGETEHV